MSETIVPAVFHDLPVIANRKQIPEYVGELQDMRWPGFVVKASRYMDDLRAIERHHDIAGDLQRAMRRQTGRAFELCLLENFSGLGQHEIGALHEDVANIQVENALKTHFSPYVHTTVSGGGNVSLAFCGTRPDLVEEYSDCNFYEEHPGCDPHHLLLKGVVDTRLMSPDVYRHDLRIGDSVVFTGTGPGIPWHRFDTQQDLGERVIVATEIMHPDV